MRLSFSIFLFFVLTMIFGCGKRLESSLGSGNFDSVSTRTTFEFSDRTIELHSLLNAFPYDSFRRAASLDSKQFFTAKSEGNSVRVYQVSLPKSGEPMQDINSGRVIPNIDLSKSLSFRWQIRKTDGTLYLSMDENNNEQFNLYRLDARAGSLEKLTQIAYLTGYNFSPDYKKIGYLARVEPKENARIQLHVIDLETGKDVIVATDDEVSRMTWSTVAWSPSGDKIAVDVVENGDRNRVNVGLVSVKEDPTQKPLLLTTTKDRPGADVVERWLSEKEILFLSNEEGVSNLFSVNVDTKEKKQLTDLKADIKSAMRTEVAGKVYFILTTGSAKGGSIQRWDAATNEVVEIFRSSDLINVLDVQGEEILINASGHTGPLNIFSLSVEKTGRESAELALGLGKDAAEQVVHCKSEEIRYKTFDDLTYQVEGEPIRGEIMATLYSPIKPAPADQMKGLVRAFYGGSLNFDMDAQVLCAAGYTVLSPAARGDASISSAFEKINDGDLGGKEIIDIIYGGKYLAEKTGIPPQRIGVFGHSHGGYASQRLITFPGKIDGVEADFPWGFALANSGFANIIDQTEGSNIPGWTRKEAGDVAIPEIRQKFLDRSPINHLDQFKARLLLVHGDVDKRVPYSGSKSIFDALVAMGKGSQVKLVTIPGMGHAPLGEKDQLVYYGAWLDFLK